MIGESSKHGDTRQAGQALDAVEGVGELGRSPSPRPGRHGGLRGSETRRGSHAQSRRRGSRGGASSRVRSQAAQNARQRGDGANRARACSGTRRLAAALWIYPLLPRCPPPRSLDGRRVRRAAWGLPPSGGGGARGDRLHAVLAAAHLGHPRAPPMGPRIKTGGGISRLRPSAVWDAYPRRLSPDCKGGRLKDKG